MEDILYRLLLNSGSVPQVVNNKEYKNVQFGPNNNNIQITKDSCRKFAKQLANNIANSNGDTNSRIYTDFISGILAAEGNKKNKGNKKIHNYKEILKSKGLNFIVDNKLSGVNKQITPQQFISKNSGKLTSFIHPQVMLGNNFGEKSVRENKNYKGIFGDCNRILKSTNGPVDIGTNFGNPEKNPFRQFLVNTVKFLTNFRNAKSKEDKMNLLENRNYIQIPKEKLEDQSYMNNILGAVSELEKFLPQFSASCAATESYYAADYPNVSYPFILDTLPVILEDPKEPELDKKNKLKEGDLGPEDKEEEDDINIGEEILKGDKEKDEENPETKNPKKHTYPPKGGDYGKTTGGNKYNNNNPYDPEDPMKIEEEPAGPEDKEEEDDINIGEEILKGDKEKDEENPETKNPKKHTYPPKGGDYGKTTGGNKYNNNNPYDPEDPMKIEEIKLQDPKKKKKKNIGGLKFKDKYVVLSSFNEKLSEQKVLDIDVRQRYSDDKNKGGGKFVVINDDNKMAETHNDQIILHTSKEKKEWKDEKYKLDIGKQKEIVYKKTPSVRLEIKGKQQAYYENGAQQTTVESHTDNNSIMVSIFNGKKNDKNGNNTDKILSQLKTVKDVNKKYVDESTQGEDEEIEDKKERQLRKKEQVKKKSFVDSESQTENSENNSNKNKSRTSIKKINRVDGAIKKNKISGFKLYFQNNDDSNVRVMDKVDINSSVNFIQKSNKIDKIQSLMEKAYFYDKSKYLIYTSDDENEDPYIIFFETSQVMKLNFNTLELTLVDENDKSEEGAIAKSLVEQKILDSKTKTYDILDSYDKKRGDVINIRINEDVANTLATNNDLDNKLLCLNKNIIRFKIKDDEQYMLYVENMENNIIGEEGVTEEEILKKLAEGKYDNVTLFKCSKEEGITGLQACLITDPKIFSSYKKFKEVVNDKRINDSFVEIDSSNGTNTKLVVDLIKNYSVEEITQDINDINVYGEIVENLRKVKGKIAKDVIDKEGLLDKTIMADDDVDIDMGNDRYISEVIKEQIKNDKIKDEELYNFIINYFAFARDRNLSTENGSGKQYCICDDKNGVDKIFINSDELEEFRINFILNNTIDKVEINRDTLFKIKNAFNEETEYLLNSLSENSGSINKIDGMIRCANMINTYCEAIIDNAHGYDKKKIILEKIMFPLFMQSFKLEEEGIYLSQEKKQAFKKKFVDALLNFKNDPNAKNRDKKEYPSSAYNFALSSNNCNSLEVIRDIFTEVYKIKKRLNFVDKRNRTTEKDVNDYDGFKIEVVRNVQELNKLLFRSNGRENNCKKVFSDNGIDEKKSKFAMFVDEIRTNREKNNSKQNEKGLAVY